MLESEVAVRARRAQQGSAVDHLMAQAETENFQLIQTGKAQHIHVAKLHSGLIQCLGPQQSHPLYTRIFLPKDWDLRQAKLLSIREEKLRNAYNFVMEPRHSTDPSKTLYSDTRFETPEGDFCGFPGVKSLQQVYDAAVYYLTNMEISITERLGHVTVRDDYETIDGCVLSVDSNLASSQINQAVTKPSGRILREDDRLCW
ncbi:hypothetical protein DVH05_022850 [Phytophthora capsici]|nr:hypothetical protein DVH05_022850 [Phytophthora capsici]